MRQSVLSTPTTRAQRVALLNLWARVVTSDTFPRPGLTYRNFRKTVEPGPGCIMVPAFGMWFGIEPDGYTHT